MLSALAPSMCFITKGEVLPVGASSALFSADLIGGSRSADIFAISRCRLHVFFLGAHTNKLRGFRVASERKQASLQSTGSDFVEGALFANGDDIDFGYGQKKCA